jgi:hypothetical protein
VKPRHRRVLPRVGRLLEDSQRYNLTHHLLKYQHPGRNFRSPNLCSAYLSTCDVPWACPSRSARVRALTPRDGRELAVFSGFLYNGNNMSATFAFSRASGDRNKFQYGVTFWT